jgi:very-short-patch-repair endonuclease
VESATLNDSITGAVNALIRKLDDREPRFSEALSYVDRHWPKGFEQGAGIGAIPVERAHKRVNSLLASLRQVREWFRLSKNLEACSALGLTPAIEALGVVSVALVSEAFEKRFLRLWVSAVLEQHPSLTDFNQVKGTELLNKHRQLDARVRQLAIARAHAVASTTAAKVNAARDVPDSEVGILRYELQKRKRIKPLRKLFAEIPQVLQALKPCLLMSPISVSTYLTSDALRFDVAVFDEASQLPTAEAAPAISRAAQVVVAGDPNQLPPTAFFESSLIRDDDEDDDDLQSTPPLESLLDDCVAIVPVFSEAHLRWHYRSRDERLIKFSNHYFYDNRLLTFPTATPDQEGQGVRFVHVPNGVYDRGRSRTNRREAREIARLALKHFERFPERSLGIVALGMGQREAIEDARDEALADRPDLAPFFDSTRAEPTFVKSLENVQGDERDTMLISVGYGRDEQGGLSMNFGPINQDGGWRRLNVLITRAKWECVVVSSVRSSDLSAINPNNRGGSALRAFLEFAERGGELPAPAATLTEGETNDFEDAVRAALVDRGFVVDAQVGAGQYRIDLAIRDARDPRRYVLGIECDGASYHSSRTARDRDLLRQQVLRGMGWRIHRVWSTEWFYERDEALAAIVRSVEQAALQPVSEGVLNAAAEVKSLDAPAAGTRSVVARKYSAGVRYQLYGPSHRLVREHLLQSGQSTTLARTIGELVAIEAPVHYDFLVERLKDLHGVDRAGSNIQGNIKQALEHAIRWQTIKHPARSAFYYDPARPVETFRLPANSITRRVDQIAPEELAMAVLHLVEDQFGIAEDRTPAAVARLFGVERLGSDQAEIIAAIVDALIADGKLRRGGLQLHLG